MMKIFVITKKTLIMIAAVLAGIAALAAILIIASKGNGGAGIRETSSPIRPTEPAPYTAEAVKEPEELTELNESYELEVLAGFMKELPVYSVERSDNRVALTIDAAWDDDKTPFILETLARYNVKATFFLCGVWVKAYPEMVKAIYDAGHTIGNHSMDHPHMTKLSETKIAEQIGSLDDEIERITGERTVLFRAPFGEYNDKVIECVRASGHEPIQWDIDTIDWKPERSSQTILDSVLSKLKSGSIILCHNNGYKIEEYLPTLIETAQANGYEFVSVNELLLQGETIIDVNGTQKLK